MIHVDQPNVTNIGEPEAPASQEVSCELGRRVREWIDEHALTEDRLGKTFRWLDLGCGKGTHVRRIPYYFEGEMKTEVQYFGVDIDAGCRRACEYAARELGLRKPDIRKDDIRNVERIFSGEKFNAVTMIYVAHEIDMHWLPELLWKMMDLCAADGFIYLFDREMFGWQELMPERLPLSRDSRARLARFCGKYFRTGRDHPVVKVGEDGHGRKGWCLYLKKSKAQGPAPGLMTVRENGMKEVERLLRKQKDKRDEGIMQCKLTYDYKIRAVKKKGEDWVRDPKVRDILEEADQYTRESWSCTRQLERLQVFQGS